MIDNLHIEEDCIIQKEPFAGDTTKAGYKEEYACMDKEEITQWYKCMCACHRGMILSVLTCSYIL